MAEKNTLSILESIKQKMMKFEQDPEKHENIFEEIKEFEYSEPSNSNKEEEDHEAVTETKVDNKQIISENIEGEESKFDLELEDYEGEEDDLLQDNSNFLFESNHNAEESKAQSSQKLNQNNVSQTQIVDDSKNKVSSQTQKQELEDDLDFDLDELEKEFLSNNSKEVSEEKIKSENQTETDEEKEFLNLDDLEELEDLEENNTDLQKPDNSSAIKKDNSNQIPEIDFSDLDFEEEDDDEDETKPKSQNKNLQEGQQKDNEIDLLGEDDEDEDEDEVFFEEKNQEQSNQQAYKNSAGNSNNVEVISSGSNYQNSYSMPLITKDTLHQTTESIRKLMDASNVVSGIKTFSQQTPFNEIALQLMEPKLEKWLNENLSELVEKIVREEIARIIPKGEEEKK